jgi:protein-disulfide isomerase
MGKAARLKRERASARATSVAAPRLRVPRELAPAVALAVVLAGASIGFIESARPVPPPAVLSHVADVTRSYAGVPQQDGTLGRADAPVTMVVYLDPQCPYCGEWERAAMPDLVARYVQPGTLRVVVHGLRFVGPDSDRALRLLDASALQNRFFQAVELLYWNQGEENTGWVTDRYLRSLAYAVSSDPERLLTDRGAAAVQARIRADEQAAADDQVTSTPWIELGRTGSQPRHVELTRLDANAVAPLIRRLAAKVAS